ncbi:hypothetical protein M406DRAFT_75122 [Cryphonectria parasitica EP155]|uniref:dihydropyrimidinase n=1 Tax=Cryphonectria parasitica (strain ATCC 38755 / EP155) TaxID=660469 RepID=A0A9P4XZP9_CRYP1|nr:uncharacterized protein M406DRAFT_75122 [Cryphonectria parasitica EP155]KAF3763891.1 hypothetical protein M406DRAFT_75122 [Cryphonectria parasitica EP155]
MFDTIIKNGRIVTATEVLPLGLEIGIKDGTIDCIGRTLQAGQNTQIVDAEGAYITPGGVDSHVHIEQDNSPTGDTWETGSRSALAGGNTTIIAFASQKRHEDSLYPALEAYHRKATGNAYCDYGFHVILTNPTRTVLEEELPLLVGREGITSVKLYMTYEPMRLGDADLFNVMMCARSLGITTMIHAENSDMIAAITERLAAAGNTGTFFHAVARPQIAETEATYRAISLAEVTDAPVLLVHMSAPRAVQHVADAQARLLPIHAETCPHYLYLVSESLRSGERDVEGSKNICAPPLRHDEKDLEEIWRGVANGTFTVISSDHAPATFDHECGKKGRAMETATVDAHGVIHADFRKVPNGLPGIETRLPLLFDRTFDPSASAHGQGFFDDKIRISLPRFVELTATNPAKLYGLGDRKGSLMPGFDADLVIWYPEETNTSVGSSTELSFPHVVLQDGEKREAVRFRITNEVLHHRIDYTPFEGIEVRNWPRLVFLRGKLVWDRDGAGLVGSKSEGQFLKRAKSSILTGQMGRRATGMMDGEWKYWI